MEYTIIKTPLKYDGSQLSSLFAYKTHDLFFKNQKLSVSISTLSPVSTLIHYGLNISSKNTPIPTLSLQDLGIEDYLSFGEKVAKHYQDETETIRLARCKVRGVL